MSNFSFSNSIIFGGLENINEQNIFLRSVQINDGLTIHTCNDYSNSLEVIKEASFGKKDKVKILSKVYYKYPDLKHKRYRPIIEQLEEMKNRLGFIPSRWSIQISCYCSLKELISKKARIFFKNIKKEFGIKKIYLESYPIYRYNLRKIILLNNFYQGEIIFSLIGYQNSNNRVFNENTLEEFSKKSLDIVFIGILGQGIQNKIKENSFNKKNSYDFLDNNLLYFLLNIEKNKFAKGITNVSSLNQYEDLKFRISSLQKLLKKQSFLNNIDNDFRSIKYYFYNDDYYGGYYSFKRYFLDPKLFLYRIKYIMKSFIKSKSFSNNFFG